MKERFRNPHTFDMNNYYSGLICVIGGFDQDRDDHEKRNSFQQNKEKASYKLDWSFLKSSAENKKDSSQPGQTTLLKRIET